LPESGIDQINEETKPDDSDALSSHLLGGKKHHDEEKNVETEEIQHATVELQKEFAEEKKAYEDKMEKEIESIRN